MLHIRRPTLHDLNECAQLDASYTTQHVWQMSLHVDGNDIQVHFRLVHLPRQLAVQTPPPPENLLKCWQRGDCLYSAREGHTIVGYIHLIPDAESGIGLIHRHVVLPQFRRKGIGAALLQHTLQWAREHRLRSLLTMLSTRNHPAIAFYLAHGFVFSGYSEDFYSDESIKLHFSRSVL
ncbi:MAG: N-acetyltransferase [Caldilineae bacterium]|nr:MAG: N-acetyltransferase [Caldilineae bacterium]